MLPDCGIGEGHTCSALTHCGTALALRSNRLFGTDLDLAIWRYYATVCLGSQKWLAALHTTRVGKSTASPVVALHWFGELQLQVEA